MSKTLEQLQAEVDFENRMKEERKISANAYSIKLVEKVLVWVVGIAAAATIAKLVEIVFTNHFK